MKLWKKLFAKQADERQQQEIYRVEHTCFWITYWLLLISIIYQRNIKGIPFEQIQGEWITFMIASICVVVGCMWKGVWNFQHRKVPGVKAYLLYSLTGAVLGGILFGVCTAAQNPYVEKLSDKVMVGLIAGACDGGIIFVLCFVAFLIVGKVTKLREQKIENEMLGDDEDE